MNRKKIAGYGLAATTVLLAVLLIGACRGVFRSGGFSREIAGEALGRIVWAFGLWLVSFVAAIVFPGDDKKPKAPDAEALLDMLKMRVEMTDAMCAEEKKRRRARGLLIVFVIACALVPVVYLAEPEHFPGDDLKADMGAMMPHVIPWLAAMFAGVLVYLKVCTDSARREVNTAKTAPKRDKIEIVPRDHAAVTCLRGVLLIAAIALLILGFTNGGMTDVSNKAVNICTECIGLG